MITRAAKRMRERGRKNAGKVEKKHKKRQKKLLTDLQKQVCGELLLLSVLLVVYVVHQSGGELLLNRVFEQILG